MKAVAYVTKDNLRELADPNSPIHWLSVSGHEAWTGLVPLYTHPLFTPTERAYLLKVLGGPLEVEGFTAQDVLVLRGKIEGVG